MGFRHYNHYFTSIQMALLSGEKLRARNMLAEWCHDGMENVGDAEIASLTIEKEMCIRDRIKSPLLYQLS